jgi:hypothetical protein
MSAAQELIGRIVLSSSQATVTFSNIPQSYSELLIVATPKGSGGNGLLGLTFNGDTGSNYTDVFMYGEGSAAGSGTATRAFVLASLSSIGTTFNPILTMSVPEYAATNRYKTSVIRYGNNDVSGVMAIASKWASLSAINSVTFKFAGTDTFATGSIFTIYGIVG